MPRKTSICTAPKISSCSLLIEDLKAHLCKSGKDDIKKSMFGGYTLTLPVPEIPAYYQSPIMLYQGCLPGSKDIGRLNVIFDANKNFISFWKEFETLVQSVCLEKWQDWFGMPFHSGQDEQPPVFYSQLVDLDPFRFLDSNESMGLTFPVSTKNVNICPCEATNVVETGLPMQTGTYCILLMEFSGLWFSNKKYGCKFNTVQVHQGAHHRMAFASNTNDDFSNFGFIDD